MSEGIRLTREQLSAMIAHARAEYPNEACGILAGRDGAVTRVYPMTNVERSPVSYLMDPKEQCKPPSQALRARFAHPWKSQGRSKGGLRP